MTCWLPKADPDLKLLLVVHLPTHSQNPRKPHHHRLLLGMDELDLAWFKISPSCIYIYIYVYIMLCQNSLSAYSSESPRHRCGWGPHRFTWFGDQVLILVLNCKGMPLSWLRSNPVSLAGELLHIPWRISRISTSMTTLLSVKPPLPALLFHQLQPMCIFPSGTKKLTATHLQICRPHFLEGALCSITFSFHIGA